MDGPIKPSKKAHQLAKKRTASTGSSIFDAPLGVKLPQVRMGNLNIVRIKTATAKKEGDKPKKKPNPTAKSNRTIKQLLKSRGVNIHHRKIRQDI